MIIAVNTRLLLPGKLEGIGRFAYETLKRITTAHPEHKFVFIFDRKFSDEFIFSDNIIPVIAHPQSRHPLLWYLFFEWGVPSIVKKYNADLFLSPDGWLSLRSNVKSVPVIHDLNFFHNSQWIEFFPRYYYTHFFPRFIHKATKIATVSEFSKQDIIRRFNMNENEIDVVYNGISEGFKPLDEGEKRKIKDKYTAGKDFFLFVGLVHPRKNLGRIIQAYDKFRALKDLHMKLLIVGSTKYMTHDVHKVLRKCKYKSDIIFTGRVPDMELKKIYASAHTLIYASLFEGFGIPILEAFKCNTPVICSGTSSMPEVGGDAACYVDPCSVESISKAFVKLTSDAKFRETLIDKGQQRVDIFSWEKTSQKLWETIERSLRTK